MPNLKLSIVFALLLACWLAPHPVCAQTGAASSDRPATVQTRTDLTAGEVRRVDKATGRVTIRHERIVNLNMPPMTMVFRVADKGMLETLQPGDRILFRAEENNGALTLTEIH